MAATKHLCNLAKMCQYYFQDSSFFMQLVMMAFTKKGVIAITMVFVSESESFKIETMRARDFFVEECLFCQ
jgi:hypothetical protein